MDYETLYSLINLGVLPAWLLLWFMPKAQITQKFVHSGFYPVVYGTFYTVFLVQALFFGAGSEEGNMTSLAGVMALFDHPNGVLIGWTHYLVFDLFVGAWIGRDALKRDMVWYQVIPCQFFALMFGPVGLLMYMLVRKFSGKANFSLEEGQASA